MEAPVEYVPNFVEKPEVWFAALNDELAWVRREDAPRSEYWHTTFGRSYTYGRGRGTRTYESQPNHYLIETGRGILEDRTGSYFEGCFLNRYGTQRDWLGWHEDDDPGIDHARPIAIITLGQARAIQFRKVLVRPDGEVKGEYGPVEELMLESGSLALMAAGMQFTHQHRIPKAGHDVLPRISMTYRGLKEPRNDA